MTENYHTSLQKLNLGFNQIGDEGDRAIAEALKDLDLDSNLIGDKGVKKIAKTLICNTPLYILNLDENRIGNMGMKF